MSSSSYIHTCVHTYIHTYIHTFIQCSIKGSTCISINGLATWQSYLHLQDNCYNPAGKEILHAHHPGIYIDRSYDSLLHLDLPDTHSACTLHRGYELTYRLQTEHFQSLSPSRFIGYGFMLASSVAVNLNYFGFVVTNGVNYVFVQDIFFSN